jgi:hypothetical protein
LKEQQRGLHFCVLQRQQLQLLPVNRIPSMNPPWKPRA